MQKVLSTKKDKLKNGQTKYILTAKGEL